MSAPASQWLEDVEENELGTSVYISLSNWKVLVAGVIHIAYTPLISLYGIYTASFNKNVPDDIVNWFATVFVAEKFSPVSGAL